MEKSNNWQTVAVPHKTESYSPIGHKHLIGLLRMSLENAGFHVAENRVTQSAKGDEISGHMIINGDTGEPDFRHMLAYTNSYNKRVPIRLVSGAEVYVCLNGMVVGDIITMRKHTGNIVPALKPMIRTAIEGVRSNMLKTKADITVMKNIDLTRTMAAELVGRMFVEEMILTSREASVVASQLRKPRFEEFQPNNLWSLYNHCTFAMKEIRVARRIPALKQLHDFTMDVAMELNHV